MGFVLGRNGTTVLQWRHFLARLVDERIGFGFPGPREAVFVGDCVVIGVVLGVGAGEGPAQTGAESHCGGLKFGEGVAMG
jgi:hypothetical protein